MCHILGATKHSEQTAGCLHVCQHVLKPFLLCAAYRVAIATTPEEDCLESYDTLPEAIEGAADAATAASCCVSSPVLTGSLNPPPDGLDRLLSEALLLIAQVTAASGLHILSLPHLTL